MELKVFLVEDELPTLKGIRENVPWDLLSLDYIGEARDGEEALPLILELRPDIVITDIKMPRMDGIQLSKKIKEFLPRIKIIFISAFDKFVFAQQAIEIGITLYVLKPITPKKIIGALQKVKVLHEKELLEAREGSGHDENTPVSLPTFEDACSLIDEEAFVVSLLFNDEKKESIVNLSELYKQDKNLVFYKGEPSGCLSLGTTEEICLERTYQYANAIMQELLGDSITIALGNVAIGKMGAHESSIQSLKTFNHKHMLGTNKIISYKELELITESNQKLINLDSGTLPGFLVMGEKEDSRIFLENFFQSPKNINLSMKNYLLYLTIDILNNIASFLSENIGDTSELISELAYPDLIIEECTTVEKAVSVLTPIIKNTLALRGKIKGAYFEVMLKAMKEIEKSYNNPKFSLISIASFCGMSPAHFSTVFKQNLEECFIKYLTNFRIDKAKTLLKTTNLRSSEIAFKVGYRDAHYFSFAFKKNVGITPIEFRDSSV